MLAFDSMLRSRLNRECQEKDAFTIDLLTALAMPCISAGHLIYQICRHPSYLAVIGGDDTISPVGIYQSEAGIRASHCVCATFSLWAFVLVYVARNRLHLRQQLVIGGVVWVCLAAELAMMWKFWYYIGSEILRYTTVVFALSPVLWIALELSPAREFAYPARQAVVHEEEAIELDSIPAQPSTPPEAHLYDTRSQSHAVTTTNDDPEEPTSQPPSTLRPEDLTLSEASKKKKFALVEPLIWSGMAGNLLVAVDGPFAFGHLRMCARKWLLLMPMTNAKLSDLDQAVALAMGLCTLLYSGWEAWKSRRITVEQ